MITRKNQVLLRFLKIRVVVNGSVIYPLETNKPVVVPLATDRSKIVVTDGFHFTKPLQIACSHMHIYYLKVACAIDDGQLAVGLVLLLLFYSTGLTSDLLILKALSFLPLLYFLYVYYINRKAFLQVTAA